MISEATLKQRSLPPSGTNNKCKQTYFLVKERIEQTLIDDNFDIFLQWSYANSTNIKEDSDVDIVVCRNNIHRDNFWFMGRNSNYLSQYNIDYSRKSFYDFKIKVERALFWEFWNSITRKNKCLRLDISNYNLVNADIVPTYELHKFINDWRYYPWIALFSDDGTYIENFPKMHQKNWEEKNQRTNWMYKDMVRLIKNCKAYYSDIYNDNSKVISSFMIENCLWNIESNIYLTNYWTKTNLCNCVIKELLRKLQHPWDFREICNLRKLFDWANNKYTPQQVQSFFILMYKLINGQI